MSSNRNIMLVLAYVWLLALIPLLTKRRTERFSGTRSMASSSSDVGGRLAWVVLCLLVLSMIPGVGCVVMILLPFIWLLFVVIRVIAIVKAFGGQRLIIPGVSIYADRF